MDGQQHTEEYQVAEQANVDEKAKVTSTVDIDSTSDSQDPESQKDSSSNTQELSVYRAILRLLGLWLGVLLVGLDGTMLATIAATVASDLGDFGQLSWVATTYAMGSSISQPLSGQLSDVFGRRTGLAVCYGLFVTGTLLCGISWYAHSLGMFLAGRVMQGLGGGSLCSIVSFIESDLVPLENRGLIEGIGNIAFGAFNALGGYYGGGIASSIGWQWAFLIQVPVIVLNVIYVLFFLRIPQSKAEVIKTDKGKPSRKNIDYVGCLCILLAMVFFQLGLNKGSGSSWDAPLVIASLAIAGTSFVLFVYWELKWASNPLIPIRHLFRRTVAASQLSFFFNSIAASANMYYVPIYFQVLGATSGESGMRFIPYAIAFGIASCVAGIAIKKLGRYYYVNLIVQACALAATACLCSLTRNTPAWVPWLYLILLGIGYGGAYVTRLMGLLSSIDPQKQAVVQAASWAINSTGNSVGIAVASAVFQHLYLGPVTAALQSQNAGTLSALKASFDVLKTLPAGVESQVIGIYLTAVRGTFFLALAAAILAAASSFVMENNRVK